jgi:hypothetical protein
MRERMLSFHAPYGCRDRGDCCSAGWAIAVEPDRQDGIDRAFRDGSLAPIASVPLVVVRKAGEPAVLGVTDSGCVFYRGSGTGRCEIHRTLGHAALPLACRRFPRVSVIDPGGVSTTLSHFCPTARALLGTREPGHLVSTYTPLDRDDTKVDDIGLDMREALPPLLRPGLFMDWEDWWLFERSALEVLARSPPDEALTRLATVVEQVRGWSRATRPLQQELQGAFRLARHHQPAGSDRTISPSEHLDVVLRAVPDSLRPPRTSLSGESPPLRDQRHFLMAHAFASWTAHLGHGLRTWLRSLEAVRALLMLGLGVREIDLLVRHLADPTALAAAWSEAERN